MRTMTTLRRLTVRLRLEPLPAAVAARLLDDRATAARLIGAALPSAWPQPDLLDLLPMQAAAGPGQERFGVWIMIERATNTIVGDVGFLGPPDHGVVEIGSSVIPERRGRGLATEAAQAMVEWALHEPGTRAVIARCDAGNAASIRVLERAGLVRTGEADGQVLWGRAVTDQG
jgi:[ribosomal protein S5]-alanine N-acetyltransferase